MTFGVCVSIQQCVYTFFQDPLLFNEQLARESKAALRPEGCGEMRNVCARTHRHAHTVHTYIYICIHIYKQTQRSEPGQKGKQTSPGKPLEEIPPHQNLPNHTPSIHRSIHRRNETVGRRLTALAVARFASSTLAPTPRRKELKGAWLAALGLLWL